MEISEKRVFASLIFLTGVSFLTLAISTGQLDIVIDLIKQIFDPAVAGLP